jgi:hypothetical protein
MALSIFSANARQRHKMSTLVRINYLCQPILGLLFKTVNFFQDGSVFNRLRLRADEFQIPCHRQAKPLPAMLSDFTTINQNTKKRHDK